MTLLVLGVLLFAGVHFIPSLAPTLKASWVSRMGENGYKGTFSLLLLLAFGLMIAGWRSADTTHLYSPPASSGELSSALYPVALALIALAFLIMTTSNRNSRIRRLVRHPQLTGVILWGGSHLLLNGDSRSVALFGGLSLWALIEIFAINRRDGVWIKDEAPPWGAEWLTLLIAAVTVAVLIYVHPWLSGVAIL